MANDELRRRWLDFSRSSMESRGEWRCSISLALASLRFRASELLLQVAAEEEKRVHPQGCPTQYAALQLYHRYQRSSLNDLYRDGLVPQIGGGLFFAHRDRDYDANVFGASVQLPF